MLGSTAENMHFGMMRAAFAEAAVTHWRSLASATHRGGVTTVVDDTTRVTGFLFPIFIFFWWPPLLLPFTTSALHAGRQVNRWTCKPTWLLVSAMTRWAFCWPSDLSGFARSLAYWQVEKTLTSATLYGILWALMGLQSDFSLFNISLETMNSELKLGSRLNVSSGSNETENKRMIKKRCLCLTTSCFPLNTWQTSSHLR